MTAAAAAAVFALAGPSLAATAVVVQDRALVRRALAPGRPAHAGLASGVRSAFRIAGMTLAAAVAGTVVAGAVGGLAAGVAAVMAPRVRRRRRLFAEEAALEDGLADAVTVMAAAIRAGRSMRGALEEAAERVASPLGPRLSALVDRVSLGEPVDRAVLDLARSVPGPDARLVAAVIGLHQRAGGDAPAVLDRVARTLRERRASAREVRSLTAQARLSGAILGFLPVAFFLFLAVTSRSDIGRALASSTGLTAIVVGLMMQATAFLWIRRLLRVDP
jgi:tight adherence protein B